MDRSSALPTERSPLLLVERDAAMRTLVAEAFAPSYQVAAVTDGGAGWESAQGCPPRLVIIGLGPHDRDGLNLIKCLRACARTATVPIVVLTSSAERELLLCCLAAGATNFLLKPFTLNELLACAQAAL